MKSVIQNFFLILKRFKTSSVLNILGLSVALAVFAISLIQAEYDFSYDTVFKKHKDIYRLHTKLTSSNSTLPVMTPMIPERMIREFPEVKNQCMLSLPGQLIPIRQQDSEETYKANYFETTDGFLDIFTPEIKEGDAKKVFEEQGYVMIAEGIAKKLFDDRSPVGLVLEIGEDRTPLTIVAVYKDFPERCSLENGIYTKMPENHDTINSFNLAYFAYFEMDKTHVDELTEKINDNWMEEGVLSSFISDLHFVSLQDLHYETEGGSRSTTCSLLAIGIVILAISYINFINFSIALAPVRIRELNIRKILGDSNTRLRLFIASEAVLFSLLSFILSLLILYLVNRSFVSEFLSSDLQLQHNVTVLAFIALAVSLAGFIIGLYPAFYTTRFQPATVLNGKFALSGKGVGLRNTLVTIQFFASIVLIIVSIFIKLQHDYMVRESWQFERDNIVYLPTHKDLPREAFIGELKSNPDIIDCTYTAFLPGEVGSFTGSGYKDRLITFASWNVAPNFLDFFGIPVAEGNGFSADTVPQIIVNRKLIADYQLEDDHILQLDVFLADCKAVGIIDDINFHPLNRPIDPMAFIKSKPGADINYILIKITGHNLPSTMDFIEKSWKSIHYGDYDVHFLDDAFDRQYQALNNLAKLITLFGSIALLIALMGVYGIVLFNAKYKRREIAIRKVNGSSIREIILMLNKAVFIQLTIAFVLAVPAAYYIITKLVESYAYRISISWWIFLLGGVIVLLITLITVSVQSYKSASANPVNALNQD